MGCVDSHASRIYIQEQLAQLPNALYVCGGNSLADGQVQVWAKTGNKQSPQIHHSHPEMQAGQDRFPDEISCSQAVTSKPQLLWANMMCANIMGAIFWQLVEHGPSLVLPRPDVKDMENEVLFDLETMSVHPIHSPSLIRKDGQ
jgi:hypothetical protein